MAARVRRDVTKAEKAAALAPVSAGAHTIKYNLVAFLLKRCYNTVKLLWNENKSPGFVRGNLKWKRGIS